MIDFKVDCLPRISPIRLTLIFLDSASKIYNDAVSKVQVYIPESIACCVNACYPYYESVCSQLSHLNQLGQDGIDKTYCICADLSEKASLYYEAFADKLVDTFLYINSLIR